MAMNITRLMASNLPLKVCVTSSASMSSAPSKPSTPSTSSSSSSTPAKIKPKRQRESLRSYLATIFGGSIDAADPNEPPIPVQKVNFPHVVEQATGEAKLLLLAFENGFLDPYCTLPTSRNGRGTKDNPVLIPSFTNERIIACGCEQSQTYFRFSKLYEGELKRCYCGFWMKLTDAPRFWEKIPKEDLITIPYFKDLDDEGKLDKILSGELDPEGNPKDKKKTLESHH